MDKIAKLRNRLWEYREELENIKDMIDALQDDLSEEVLMIDLNRGAFSKSTKSKSNKH